MLLNLHKKSWMDGMALEDYEKHCDTNRTTVKEMLELAKSYNKVNIKMKTNFFLLLQHLVFIIINRPWRKKIK